MRTAEQHPGTTISKQHVYKNTISLFIALIFFFSSFVVLLSLITLICLQAERTDRKTKNMAAGSYSSLLSALPKISHFRESMSTASSCNTNTEDPRKLTDVEPQSDLCARWKQEVTSSMYSSRSRAFLKSYSFAPLLSSQMYSCGHQRTVLWLFPNSSGFRNVHVNRKCCFLLQDKR